VVVEGRRLRNHVCYKLHRRWEKWKFWRFVVSSHEHRDLWPEIARLRLLSLLNKPTPSVSGPGDPVPVVDPWLAEDFPFLWSYLADESYADGTPRKRSTLTVFVEDGLVKGCLNDRDNARSVFMSGEDLESLLAALEGQVQEKGCPWRMQEHRAENSKGGRKKPG